MRPEGPRGSVRGVLVACTFALACGDGEQPERAPPVDASLSAAVAARAQDYCATAPTCSSDADLSVTGISPFGRVQLTDLSVSYVVGETTGTRLTFLGESDGRPFLLLVRLVADLSAAGDELAVSPAGSYWADSAHILRTLPDGSCAVDALTAEAAILEHQAPAAPALGDRIYFGGSIRATGHGFALDIDFEARKACGTTRDE